MPRNVCTSTPQDGEYVWTMQKVNELLDFYEEEPILWNINHEDYHKKDIRQVALDRLSLKIDVSVAEISKKLNNMRTYYNKQLTKCKKSRVTHAEGPHRFKSKWPFFKRMDSFLNSQIVPRTAANCLIFDIDREVSNLENMEDSESPAAQNNIVEEPATEQTILPQANSEPKSSSNGVSIQYRKRKSPFQYRSSFHAKRPNVVNRNLNLNSNTSASSDDEDDIYGKYIANEMRMIKDHQAKQLVKLQIQGLLYQAQTAGSAPRDLQVLPSIPGLNNMSTPVPQQLYSNADSIVPPKTECHDS